MAKERFGNEMLFRRLLEEWEMRFHEPTLVSADALAQAKNQFMMRYGWEETIRVRNEVVGNCSVRIRWLLDQEKGEKKPVEAEILAVATRTSRREMIASGRAKKREEKRRLPYRRQPVFA